VTAGRITFTNPPGGLVDCYAGCAWPERFTRDDLETRRRKTKTANYWDSQYQLHSRPIHDIRLDPSKMPEYTCEPVMRRQNGVPTMWLGSVQIMSLSLRWDPSSGKLKSDTSAVALILQDGSGRRYWHRAVALKGEIAEFDPLDNKTIIGGQVHQLADLVREFNVPRVVIETNGIGAFSSAIVLACFQQQGLRCGVEEIKATTSKNPRILEAFEGPLSSSMLWAHSSVLDGPAWDEMKDWNPAIREQPDDFLDAAAGAITDAPERVRSIARDQGDKFKTLNGHGNEDWRPSAGVFEVEVTH
jgi:hypothetical protein